MHKKFLPIVFAFLLLLAPLPVAHAETSSLATATSLVINDNGIKDGDIITTTKDGYKRATIPNDPLLFGVVSLHPAVYLEDAAIPNAKPVVTLGKVNVRVSTMNGAIKPGDFITSSTIPGVGEKATDNGVVIGTAEGFYNEKNPKKIGMVLVTLNPHFAQINNNISKNIFTVFNLGITSAALSPLGVLRYIVAAFIAVISFYMGFRFFGHASRSGVEAIGRNPLASKIILLGIGLNVTLTIGIMFFGVAVAYLILVL